MSNKELIERARIKAGVMEMGERIQWGSDTAIMREAADALELADKRIAELEAERPISHDDWYALCNKYDAAAQKAAELSIRCDEAERKLAVARDELLRCKRIMLHECGIGLVNEVVLAQIAATEQK